MEKSLSAQNLCFLVFLYEETEAWEKLSDLPKIITATKLPKEEKTSAGLTLTSDQALSSVPRGPQQGRRVNNDTFF